MGIDRLEKVVSQGQFSSARPSPFTNTGSQGTFNKYDLATTQGAEAAEVGEAKTVTVRGDEPAYGNFDASNSVPRPNDNCFCSSEFAPVCAQLPNGEYETFPSSCRAKCLHPELDSSNIRAGQCDDREEGLHGGTDPEDEEDQEEIDENKQSKEDKKKDDKDQDKKKDKKDKDKKKDKRH